MKWYERVIYRVANAVLPDNVKKVMMGIGRMTVPKNANPWNMFNWLPKKYQSAHNIDLTKLQNYTAEELLELLISVHPDISHALHTYLRMGDTPITVKADDEGAQSVLDGLSEMLNTPLDSPGYQHGRSLDKLDTIQRLMVMVRGACAGEVVLDEACKEVVDIVPVDPALIWFRREPDMNRLVPYQFVRYPKMQPGEDWFGQYKRIDTPTFIYEELDPLVDDPYGRTPILPTLQVVFFHLQVLQDLKAVVHNQGYPRMRVKILEEIMLKNMPAQFKNDPNAQRQWLGQRMNDITTQFNGLNPDDALVFWDSVETEYLKGSGTGPMIDVKQLIDIIDTQLATSLKTLLTLLSRHQGSTETYSSVDVQLYIKTVESARNITRRFWERAFSMAARISGVQTTVDVDYAPIDLRTENEVENDRRARLTNLESAESNFYITPEEAATEVRKMFGMDPDIPPELVAALQVKQEQRLTPAQENPDFPPNTNSRVKLSVPAIEQQQETADEQFMAWYLSLMSHVRDQGKHATSLDSLKAGLIISDGVTGQLRNALYQLYRDTYVDSYNERAELSGTSKIRFPGTQTSVELHMQASRVIQGVNDTYTREMINAVDNAIEATKDFPESEQLAEVKKAMNDWADERMAYKSEQIANKESADGYHKGMFAHDEANAPQTMYGVEPTTSDHDACIEIIQGAPYTLEQAKALTLPLHPNCPHRFVAIQPEGGEN